MHEKVEKKRTATEGLLWLLRGLEFTLKSLKNLQENKTEELSAAFTKGYEGSLKQFHNFVVKGIFAVRGEVFFWHCLPGLCLFHLMARIGCDESVPVPRRFLQEARC